MLYVVARASARVGSFAWLTCASVLLGGCTDTMLLGSECATDAALCQPSEPVIEIAIPVPGIVDTPAPPAPIGSLDGGLLDGSRTVEPALEPPEAGAALPGFSLIALQNASFERHGGVGGDVVLSDAVSTLVPVAPVDTIFAELPSWYACFPLSVSSLTWQTTTNGTARSMFGDYLSFVVNGTTVRQTLEAPLEAGTSYSFEAKVMSRSEGKQNLRLEVRGATSSCGAGYVLGRSAKVPDSETWERSCVTFTADKPYTYLLLAPSADGPAPSVTARFYLDELRQVASCTGMP